MSLNPPSVDISTMLQSDGVGTIATDLFVGREPDSPDECITIYDTQGEGANPKFLLDLPTIQVRVRSNTYLGAYDKIQSIKDKLLGRPTEVINSTRYVGIWAQTEIAFLQKDESERQLAVINFLINREPDAGDHRTVT